MKIYGDQNSGNCLKVKWVADRLALPYEWIEIDTLKGGSRTAEFLKLNPWGQVPAVVLDDGRTLAQSNAIIRYLARGSELIPADAFAAAKMDEWLFWEQYSHEPYVAVCRFHMVYLGRKASELDPEIGQARHCRAGSSGASSRRKPFPGWRDVLARGCGAGRLYPRRA